MPTRILTALGLSLTLTLLLPPLSLAQAAQDDTVYHLHGTVLDAVTGKGIGQALVSSIDHRLATLTDSKGQFTFDLAMPPNSPFLQSQRNVTYTSSIFFSAERPGYTRMEPLAVQIDNTLSTRSTEIRLTPAASIAGHVYAPGSNAPRNVPVTLLQRAVQEGLFIWRPGSSRNTDRTGAFHFSNLQPGEYLVMTQEWRGENPLPSDRKSTTTQYPPVFLGDAPTLQSSTPLLLHPGETASTELHLHSATYYPVTIPVAGQTAGLNVLIGPGMLSGYNLGYVARDNAVEGSLPNGSYDLQLNRWSPPDDFASAELNIHVAGAPLRTAPVTLTPGSNLTVRLHLELTAASVPPQVGLNLQLQPEELGGRGLGGNAQPGETEFSLKSVQPGRYTVVSYPSYGYVSRIASGGVDLLDHPLTVNASGSPEPIDVTIRDDAATLSGNLGTGDDPPPARSFVVLLAEHRDRPLQTAFSSGGRAFTFMNIPPGTYRLFGLANSTRDLPYRDPQAILPLLTQGKLITLAPDEKATADAPLITPPDPLAAASSTGGTQ